MNKKEKKTSGEKGEVVIYKSPDGTSHLEVKLEEETVWLNLNQIAMLFDTDKSGISRHISNIYKSNELRRTSTIAKIATVQTEGDRQIKRNIEYFSLDVILSVGYRVNSKRATQFRIWATQVLKDNLVRGYSINEKRLQENNANRLKELEQTVQLLASITSQKKLASDEATGLLNIITDYTRSWILLHQYDTRALTIKGLNENVVYAIDYDEARKLILHLKAELIKKKEAGDIFGTESEGALKGILAGINQTFDGKELYPTIEEKAAHLLYFVIKDHPFLDGNKRLASLFFVWFLDNNNYLYKKDGEKKINDNTLVALALLVAESNPTDKNLMVRLIINLIKNS